MTFLTRKSGDDINTADIHILLLLLLFICDLKKVGTELLFGKTIGNGFNSCVMEMLVKVRSLCTSASRANFLRIGACRHAATAM